MNRYLGYLLAFVLVSSAIAAVAEERSTPGIVSQRPAQGRFVETEEGFMVPYFVNIPDIGVSIEMIPVSGGIVQMGSPANEPGRNPQDEGQRLVRIEPFWIGKYEVTVAQYRPFMDFHKIFRDEERARSAGGNAGRSSPKETDLPSVDAVTAPTEVYEPSYHFEYGDEQQPIATVSQFAGRQYTKWLSLLRGQNEFYRLPTEAEWEYACRAGTTTAYSFGNDPADLPKYAVVDGAQEPLGPTVVGQRLPNAWGLHDMHGNVAEWVIDAPGPREAAATDATPVDWKTAIVWPTRVEVRMVRGGGWTSTPADCRSAAKTASSYDWWESDPHRPRSTHWLAGERVTQAVGFRILRSLHNLMRSEQERFWSPDCPDLETDVRDSLREGRSASGEVSPKQEHQLRVIYEKRNRYLEKLKSEAAEQK